MQIPPQQTNTTPRDLSGRPPNHFTASAIVIESDQILLVYHKRIGAWVPPGGHIEEGEYPHEACVREVFEETGIKVEVASDPVPKTKSPEAFFPPQPLCMHIVQAIENGDACFHIDLAYICKVTGQAGSLPDLASSQGTSECRWVKLNRLSEVLLAENVTELVDLALAKCLSGKIS
jgi:8-oxo-dGTP pyrophosphatase MutT (NUDIX family)